MLAGSSRGSVNGTENDDVYYDIVAVKLDANTGEEIWNYQVCTAIHVLGCRRVCNVAEYLVVDFIGLRGFPL